MKNQRYKKYKFYIVFAALVALLAGNSRLWGLSPLKEVQEEQSNQIVENEQSDQITQNNQNNQIAQSSQNTQNDQNTTSSLILPNEDSLIVDSTPALFYSPKVWSYPECFNDSNAIQLIAAERNGISPTDTRERVMELVADGQLTCISPSPYYIVEDLTHSMPYLVPKAQMLLNTIGINYVDSLQSKGYPLHLPIVTSVLRTAHDVQNLQQGNVNSVTNSCHCYGTTIDITYNRFAPITGTDLTRYDDNLKKVLAEVLFDLKAQELCYVKYEKLQACFHLTVR